MLGLVKYHQFICPHHHWHPSPPPFLTLEAPTANNIGKIALLLCGSRGKTMLSNKKIASKSVYKFNIYGGKITTHPNPRMALYSWEILHVALLGLNWHQIISPSLTLIPPFCSLSLLTILFIENTIPCKVVCYIPPYVKSLHGKMHNMCFC